MRTKELTDQNDTRNSNVSLSNNLQTTHSTGSIWDTLNEDEERKTRLRNRLMALRYCANSSMTSCCEDTSSLHLKINDSVDSHSTIGPMSTSTSSHMQTQEEAALNQLDSTRGTSSGSNGGDSSSNADATLEKHADRGRDNNKWSHEQLSGPKESWEQSMMDTTIASSSEGTLQRGTSSSSSSSLERRIMQESRKSSRQRSVRAVPSLPPHTTTTIDSTDTTSRQQQTIRENNNYNRHHNNSIAELTTQEALLYRKLQQNEAASQTTRPTEIQDTVSRSRTSLSVLEEKQIFQSEEEGQISREFMPHHTTTGNRPTRQFSNRHRVGAFPVEGRTTGRTHQRDSTAESSPTRPSRTLSITSMVPVAAMVVEDYDMDELTAKEQQLREQEKEIAEKMARLQAWEEELQRQKEELELRQGYHLSRPPFATTAIVQAEVVDVDDQSRQESLVSSQPYTVTHSINECGNSFVDDKEIHFEINDEKIRWEQALAELGEGPLQFFPRGERSVEEQVEYLPTPDKIAFKNLKQSWKDYQAKQRSFGSKNGLMDLSSSWHLRYLRFTATRGGAFAAERAFQAEKKLKKRFLTLNAFTLHKQLNSKTLFPVPGLKTKGGHAMFYMRPSRFVPGKTTTKAVIDNLCYVINTMLETEHAQQEGIGFIACMDDWKMKNFEINYCYQFMMGLQGFMVPVKTQLFLIVNPPAWFGVVWRMMKPMLAPSFRKRVKICNESKIAKYLAPDFASHLPDDMSSGNVPTDAIVSDFICYRQYVEASLLSHNVLLGSDDGQSISHQSQDTPYNDNRMDELESLNEDLVSPRRGVHMAAARMPRAGTDCSTMSGSDSNWMDRSFQYNDDDDDDLASIDADINEEHLCDHEDMKQVASASASPPFGRR